MVDLVEGFALGFSLILATIYLSTPILFPVALLGFFVLYLSLRHQLSSS